MKVDGTIIRAAKECSPTIQPYRSKPNVNMNDDMVRITIDMPKREGQRFFKELFADSVEYDE